MSYLIKELPVNERPRERFKKYGVEALSNEELLSILLRTGTGNKSVKEVSLDILKMFNMNDLKDINFNSLKEIKGVGEVKAITILSAIEFGKRVLSKKDLIYQIKTGDDVFNLVKSLVSLFKTSYKTVKADAVFKLEPIASLNSKSSNSFLIELIFSLKSFSIIHSSE